MFCFLTYFSYGVKFNHWDFFPACRLKVNQSVHRSLLWVLSMLAAPSLRLTNYRMAFDSTTILSSSVPKLFFFFPATNFKLDWRRLNPWNSKSPGSDLPAVSVTPLWSQWCGSRPRTVLHAPFAGPGRKEWWWWKSVTSWSRFHRTIPPSLEVKQRL